MAKASKKLYAGIKSVSRAPNFVKTIQGKLDSKKGELVAKAHINKLKDKCVAIESRECLITERNLAGVRIQAAAALSTLSYAKKQVEHANGDKAAHSVSEIREIQKLYQIKEKITHMDATLEERIIRTRKKACVKIDAYLSGLHKGGMTSFVPDLNFSDEAPNTYHSKHEETDNAIFNCVKYGGRDQA